MEEHQLQMSANRADTTIPPSELDQLGLRDNTIVVFTSDNGAMQAGSSLPLRGAKHSIYEGGVRLPTAIHWPKGGLAGGKQWDGLCGALDLFPTLMAMTDSKMPATRPLDGRNIWPALRDNAASPVESCYGGRQWPCSIPSVRRNCNSSQPVGHNSPPRDPASVRFVGMPGQVAEQGTR